MLPKFQNGTVIAHCPDCNGAVSSFEHTVDGKSLGTVIVDTPHRYNGEFYKRTLYFFTRCANCRRGGLAKVHDNGKVIDGVLEEFFPFSVNAAAVPAEVPAGILDEFREAEKCASFGVGRAASALFRSTLEKTLRANGYLKGNLQTKIDEAAADGVITDARRKRAHDDIRVLGNDVLHDEWREVMPEEVEAAHRYAQRVLEDFYDDRKSVETILVAKKRITAQL